MTSPRPQTGSPAALAIVGAAMLWGTTGTAQALGPAGAAPAAVGTVRLVLGGLVLVLLAGGRLPARLRGGELTAALVTALAIAGYQWTFFTGVDRAGVALGTVVAIGSAPAVTGLLGWLVRREPPERGWGLATLLAVSGCALLLGTGGGGGAMDAVGLVLTIGAGTCYAVYTLGAKALLDAGRAPAEVMAIGFGGGALLAAPLLVGLDIGWLAQPRGVAMAAWLALATMGLSYALFGRGLAGLPPATVATLSLAEPLTAATLGVAVLGERPGAAGLVGGLLVLAGLVVLAVPRARPTR